MKSAIIMAAGKGTRMYSDLPKVLHKVCQKPMVECLLDSLVKTGAENVVTIVGYGKEQVQDEMKNKTKFAIQDPQLGTAHAVMQAKQLENIEGETLVINGDCPCIQPETFKMLYEACVDAKMVVLTAILEDPKAYGRVVRNKEGFIEKIVEFKDCNEEEKLIKEINTGIYCFDNKSLFKHLNDVNNNNAQKEYYITDLVKIFNNNNLKVKALVAKDNDEVQGVNNKVELASANKYMQHIINNKLMLQGVNIIDPNVTYISDDVTFGKDCIVYPNVYLEGKCVIGNNVTLFPGTFLRNAVIKDNETINKQ